MYESEYSVNCALYLPRNSTRPIRFAFGFGNRNSKILTVNDILMVLCVVSSVRDIVFQAQNYNFWWKFFALQLNEIWLHCGDSATVNQFRGMFAFSIFDPWFVCFSNVLIFRIVCLFFFPFFWCIAPLSRCCCYCYFLNLCIYVIHKHKVKCFLFFMSLFFSMYFVNYDWDSYTLLHRWILSSWQYFD